MDDDGRRKMGYNDGGVDTREQFHRDEAISAVADEVILGEEDDDDYEDLYNDVNVGEGFLQSMRKNEDMGGYREEEADVKVKIEPLTVSRTVTVMAAIIWPKEEMVKSEASGGGASLAGVDGGGERGARFMVSGGMQGFQNKVMVGNEMGGGRPGMPPVTGGGLKVELGQGSSKASGVVEQNVRNNIGSQGNVQQQPPYGGEVGSVGNVVISGNEGMVRQGGGVNMNVGNGAVGNVGGGGGGNGTILFVGDLHWWTTDADVEAELCKYGAVKEIRFYDEKASGKSKGYCQVEFFNPSSATECKEGMNGHVFNGRPCVVAFASPFSVKKMGEAQVNRNQQMPHTAGAQAWRGPSEAGNKIAANNIGATGNFQGGDRNTQGGDNNNINNNNNRGYGRGNWGRGFGQGMGNRGPGGPMRHTRIGGMGGRGIMGNGGNGFGQGMVANQAPMLHPQAMMGQGFDPSFGGPMMGGYGGFPGAPPPFSGMMPSFPPVPNVGLPGIAPHVNPAFFGRGMPMNGMGMMHPSGIEAPHMGMWQDPNMSGWAGEDQGGRAGESSYGYAEEAASDQQYGEVGHDRSSYSMKEKERSPERDRSGSSDRRYRDNRAPVPEREIAREKDMGHDHDRQDRRPRDDREVGRNRDREHSRDSEHSRDHEHSRDRDREKERDRYKEDRYADHPRYRDRETEYDDERERGRSSRTHSKSRMSHEQDQRSRSRDSEYGKRRRVTE